MFILIKRILENFAACFISSIVLSSLILYKLVDSTRFNCYIIMSVSAILFIVVNIYFLRAFFVFSRDIRFYFKVNYISYGIFAFVNIAALLVCYFVKSKVLNTVYTLFFLPFNVFNIFLGKQALISAFAMHIIILAVIYIAPLTTNAELLSEMDEIDERTIFSDQNHMSEKHKQ